MSDSANQPAALPAFKIDDLMGQQDNDLGKYIATGEARYRQAAETEALHDLWAICNALSAYEDSQSVITSTTVVRLAGLGETLVARLVELRSQGERSSD